jgi:hypothetical protein
MKKTMINQTHIEGVLYEHALEAKVTGDTSKNPGTPFITGTISIATDDAMTNIVPVHFTYVTAVFGSGKPNDTYTTLNNIVNGTFGTYMKDGADKAVKLRIDSAIGLNEFYADRNGKEELVSAKRNEGGFVHKVDALDEDEKVRNTFKVDMLINNVTRIDADEEKNLPEKVVVKGAIFDFRKSLLPVEFSATNPNAMNYFEGLGASPKEPVFTCVWGRQVSEVIVRQIRTESAFGEDEVREVKNTRRDFVITGAAKDPYVWDDESSITAAELNEAIQKREVDLAAMKKRQDEYKASRNGGAKATATAAPAKGGFDF